MLVEEILSRGRNSGGNERKEKEKERSRMEEVEHLEGLIEVGLVFLVMKTNTKGKRWSTASKGGTGTAVSQEFEKHWIGFVKLVSLRFIFFLSPNHHTSFSFFLFFSIDVLLCYWY